MKVVATICSRKKSDQEGLLPAQDRYLGIHIAKVRGIAKDKDVPFYILSGKYGLIEGTFEIPDYDYLLTDDAVPALVELVAQQMREAGITEVDFYSESNPNWRPYERAAKEGAESAEADLVMHQI